MFRGWLVVFILFVCMLYAVIRYVGFGGVSPEQLPMYVGNKAVALAAVVLLIASRWGDASRRREYGILGFGLVVVHLLLSMAILTPSYFGKFFHDSGLMRWQAEASLLAGALATLALCRLFFGSPAEPNSQPSLGISIPLRWLGRGMLILVALHVAFMGYEGWLTPEKWHGGLPPITLVSCLAVVLGLSWPRRASS